MVKLPLFAAFAATLLAPVAAEAVPLTFTITGDYAASFTIDSNPTPNEYIGGTGLVLWNVAVTAEGATGPADIGFFDGTLGGGLSIIDYADFSPYFVADGPQLYSGAVSAPEFRIGTYQLTEYEGTGRYTLTIAGAAAAVPEPASWALMIVGVGAAGATLRRRPLRTGAAVTA